VNEKLEKLFINIEEDIREGKYELLIIDKKRFAVKYVKTIQPTLYDSFDNVEENLESYFVFDEKRIVEYVGNFIVFKWLMDRHDNRRLDFTYVLQPTEIEADMADVSIQELIGFISPQTVKSAM